MINNEFTIKISKKWIKSIKNLNIFIIIQKIIAIFKVSKFWIKLKTNENLDEIFNVYLKFEYFYQRLYKNWIKIFRKIEKSIQILNKKKNIQQKVRVFFIKINFIINWQIIKKQFV